MVRTSVRTWVATAMRDDGRNYSLKEEIRDYWSARAASFDDQSGHGMQSPREVALWAAVLRDALGPVAGKRVLDLACGTGELSRVALGLGADVVGIDFAEPMIERARRKHAGAKWSGWLDDVESLTSLPDQYVDGAITRHLVWTLTDPAAAFRTWSRVLKPGARLLVIDGDWVREGLRGRLLRRLADQISPKDGIHPGIDWDRHRHIIANVAYRDGLTAARLLPDLAAAGFTAPRHHRLWPVYWGGTAGMPVGDRLRLLAPPRFALSVAKPA